MANRPAIPEKLKQTLLYESAFVCVVCQIKNTQIHHIDKDNSNNSPDNLVVVCLNHHDEAHATKTLSQNLTPARLQKSKLAWVSYVKQNRNQTASLEGQLQQADEWSSFGMTWGYINHHRVAQLLDSEILKGVDQGPLRRCQSSSIVDQNGFLLKPQGRKPSTNYFGNTVYSWFPFGDDQALHKLYSDFVDQIAQRVTPIHLDKSSWMKKFIGNCLQEGQFIFFTKAQFFKRVSEDVENAHIRVKTTQKKITIKYYVDTMNMFGTTSISVSFSGHKSCSSLVQIKSIDKTSENWILHCTPIALGVGFCKAL